jgi:hypothetical protein
MRNRVLVEELYFHEGANPIQTVQEHGGTPPITQDNRPTWVAASELVNFKVQPHPATSLLLKSYDTHKD